MFLAVSPSELLTFINNKPLTTSPYFRNRYTISAHASVDSLLALWGISLEHLDKIATPLIRHDFELTRTKPNTKQLKVAEQTELGEALRYVRIARMKP